jgi:2-polyprenyl-3-methyl-5-hydroxy-6-metoxy-1,4-benzoquinol methylase
MAGSPPYPHPHHGSTAPIGPEDLYTSQPPWDIGRPQPAFLALADAGAIRGRVLDVGCGTGEHVLMCAGLGLDATGVDLASAALHAAKEKARDRGRTARFLLQDARHLADLGESFDTVLDCG